MQNASGMCTSISRLFCSEFWAEKSSWCQTWTFLISSTQNKLLNHLAVSWCGHTGAEMRPPASPPAADPGLVLISRDNRRRFEVLAALHPPRGCGTSQHTHPQQCQLQAGSSDVLKTAASAQQFLVTGWGTPYTKIRKADFSCQQLDKPLKFRRWNILSK